MPGGVGGRRGQPRLLPDAWVSGFLGPQDQRGRAAPFFCLSTQGMKIICVRCGKVVQAGPKETVSRGLCDDCLVRVADKPKERNKTVDTLWILTLGIFAVWNSRSTLNHEGAAESSSFFAPFGP